MRILQILPELNVGGVETGTIDFAKYLIQHGFYNVVVSNGGSLVVELDKIGVRHYSLPVHKKSLWSMYQCIKPLRKIIQEEKIDVVHARSRVPAWIAYFACQHTSAQWLTTCHGFYNTHFYSRIMAWPKLVIVPSGVIGRHMIDSFKVAPESIRHIPRGVDLNRFDLKQEKPKGESRNTIACLGRLTPIKGHEYFLRAMVKVVRSMPFTRIWIIGDTPPNKESYKRELQLLVKRLGLSQHVEFLGNRSDVPQLLAQTDVMVLASIKPESFGRAILEAQAMGVPVVATRVGGFLEIIDDQKTGLLVLPRDPDEMADAVLTLLRDKGLGRQMALAAQEKLKQNFAVEKMAQKTLEVYEELSKSLRILVIKISSLGDVILIIPALKALRQRFPKAKIHCLVGREYRKILQRCPYVDEVIVIDHKHRDRGLFSVIRFTRQMRRYKFDKIIDLQNSKRSHLLAFLCFARETYGFDNGKWGFLLNRKVRLPPVELAPVEHQFQILQMLDMKYEPDNFLELSLSERDKRNARKLLELEWIAEGMHLVGIHISASEKWLTKNWPPEYIAALCDMLAPKNIRVVLTGTSQDKARARYIVSLTKTKPADLVGKTDVMELAALIKRCQVFISPDSAPLHIAAAMQTPVVAFFGPTLSLRHMPPGKSSLVYERQLKCAPCYRPRCRIFTHVCMHEILPEEVFKGVMQLRKENK